MRGQINKNILGSKLQRRLRKSMTDAEQRLWRVLRRKQLAEYKFRRQHPFGDYVIDFVCLEARLVIEVDGGQHGALEVADRARTEYLQRAGFRVLRFWNNEVLCNIDSVTETIWGALLGADATPILTFCSTSSVPLPLNGNE